MEKLSAKLDRIANELEDRGFSSLAEDIDVISNTLDSKSAAIGGDESSPLDKYYTRRGERLLSNIGAYSLHKFNRPNLRSFDAAYEFLVSDTKKDSNKAQISYFKNKFGELLELCDNINTILKSGVPESTISGLVVKIHDSLIELGSTPKFLTSVQDFLKRVSASIPALGNNPRQDLLKNLSDLGKALVAVEGLLVDPSFKELVSLVEADRVR